MKTPDGKRFDRRSFIKAGGAGLTGLALARRALRAQTVARADYSERRVYALNHRWLYSDKVIGGGTAAGFDDRAFARVNLPHTNRVLPWHGFDDKEYEFVSLYRRHFRVPAEAQRARRAFVDFGGVMTAATVHLNGARLGEYRGGYTPFSFELTGRLDPRGENVLAVEVDSTERADIPPFGGEIDYLTFGGIYRDVSLRFVPETFIENLFAKPLDVMSDKRRVDVRCYINGQGTTSPQLKLNVELRDGERVVASESRDLSPAGAPFYDVTLAGLGRVELWDLDRPKLYEVRARLLDGARVVDHYDTRVGFREARFTPGGFFLNGRHVKLRGLNRHQTFPFVGQAMPARVQRRDAWILRRGLKCNIVRTSHYPQSPHFLDACDDYGLLVLEEIPGWQHVGDAAWKELAVRNVEAMIRRDWNHPSIILWGVRINESRDDHDFYTRTNATARALDDSRPTCGVRYFQESEFLEDVFTMNDFGFPLRPPNHPLYLNTEFIGHTYPTKRNDNVERITEHTLRHARVHNQLGSNNQYAGGIGWCAFDYNTHANFCSGDRVCYHGVSDIFRIPKPAAGFYKSQCDPSEEVVLEPAFYWARGDRNESFDLAVICSNCDHLKLYIAGRPVAELDPDRKNFPHLPHPPFTTDLRPAFNHGWGDLKIEGYIGGRLIITKQMSGRGVDAQLLVEPDDAELNGDGIDATRVVLRVADEYGSPRPFASGAVALTLEGPGEIIGENPFALFGGAGAVWVRAKEAAGLIRLTAKHPTLGAKTVEIRVRRTPADVPAV